MNIITKTKTHYDEPELLELDAQVLSCKEDKGEYLVELDETLFYVESGGQPADKGTIDNHEVIDVYVYDGRVYHVLNQPVEGSVHLVIDYKRRLLNMQRQSCQHMVASLILRKLGIPVPSARVYEDGTCDLDLVCSEISLEKLQYIEDEANKLIRENVPFKINYNNLERASEIVENTYGDIDDYKDLDELRSIEIVGLDEELCGCIHVPSAGYIQGVYIQKVEKITDGYKLILSCGEHLLACAKKDNSLVHEIGADLGVKPEEAISAIEGLRQQNKAEAKAKENYRQLFLNGLIESKKHELEHASQDAPAQPHVLLVNDPSLTLEDIKYLIVNYVKMPQVVCIGLKEDNQKLSVVISKSRDVENFNAGLIFKTLQKDNPLGGGGSPLVAQGGGKVFDRYEEIIVNCVKGALEEKNQKA